MVGVHLLPFGVPEEHIFFISALISTMVLPHARECETLQYTALSVGWKNMKPPVEKPKIKDISSSFALSLTMHPLNSDETFCNAERVNE